MIDNHNEVKKKLKVEFDNLFDRFWDLYPRKVGKAKCVKKFYKLCDGNLERGEAIIEGLRKYIPVYSSRTKKFVPYPYTWLSQERWEDDIESEYDEIF